MFVLGGFCLKWIIFRGKKRPRASSSISRSSRKGERWCGGCRVHKGGRLDEGIEKSDQGELLGNFAEGRNQPRKAVQHEKYSTCPQGGK